MKKGFCVSILLILLLTPFSVAAESSVSFSAGEPLDPYSFPMLLSDYTVIDFDNSNMCEFWDSLTSEQQSTITSNIGLNNYNFAFLTSDNDVYLGTAVWISSYDAANNSYTIHSQSNISNPGFYLVGSDGSTSKQSELGTFTIQSIFYSLYDVGSYWFEDIDIRTSNCEVVINPVNPPSLNLPSINPPEVNSDSVQHSYIQSISSPSSQGGYVHVQVVDYFNIYSVVQTSETDLFFDNLNDNYYTYVESNHSYIYAVYDRSVITVYAPNMSVASVPFSVQAVEIGGLSFSFPFAGGVIQRDVTRFDYEYVDLLTKQNNDFDKLPFSNSSDNQNHVEYLGTKTQSYLMGTSSSSVNINVNNNGINIHFFFVVTDKYDTIQIATNINNQNIIDNNMNQNFINLDQVLQHGNSTSQNAQNSNNQSNSNLDNTLNNFENIENQYNQNINDQLEQIDLNFDTNNFGANFLTSAEWFTAQFDNIISDSPIASFITFILVVGVGMLLIGRFFL